MDRIVDIGQDGRHLRRERGFLLVEEQGQEIGRVALDEVHALLIHAHGITYSNSLLTALAEQGAVTVICSSNHFPTAIVTSLDGHHLQGARMRAQWQASKPLHKQLWKQLVVAKVQMQAALLEAYMKDAARLGYLARQVRSGDPDNVEAQAARVYWPLLFGADFRRDRQLDGVNAMLNYGYTVLRASIARALVASGLNASIGVHHKNQYNAFALVDDLMEPFRPLVDACVLGLAASGIETVNPQSKQALVRLIALDLDCGSVRSPVSVVASRLCFSLSSSFEAGKAALELPQPPSAMELRSLGRTHVEA